MMAESQVEMQISGLKFILFQIIFQRCINPDFISFNDYFPSFSYF